MEIHHRIVRIGLMGLQGNTQFAVLSQADRTVAEGGDAFIDQERQYDFQGVGVAVVAAFTIVVHFFSAFVFFSFMPDITGHTRLCRMAKGAGITVFIRQKDLEGFHGLQFFQE